MSDSEEDHESDHEGYSSYVGERKEDSRPHGQGVAVFAQTLTRYEGMWDEGRPAGQGRFTFLGGRHFDLKVERPSAPDFMKSPSTFRPGHIWPQDGGQGRLVIISGLTYACSTEHGRVCLKADAKATREQGLPTCIVAASVIGGRCGGAGRLEWALANGARASYEGQLQGTASRLAIMHGQVSSHASACRTPEHWCPSLRQLGWRRCCAPQAALGAAFPVRVFPLRVFPLRVFPERISVPCARVPCARAPCAALGLLALRARCCCCCCCRRRCRRRRRCCCCCCGCCCRHCCCSSAAAGCIVGSRLRGWRRLGLRRRLARGGSVAGRSFSASPAARPLGQRGQSACNYLEWREAT